MGFLNHLIFLGAFSFCMVYNSYLLHVDKKKKKKTVNFSLQESLLVDNKAQESGSRNSFWTPGFKGCHRLALQSVTHKPCLRSRTSFISTHTPYYPQTAPLSLPPQLYNGTITDQVLLMSEAYVLYMWDYCV